jgi:hypothetical protein
VAFRCLNGVLHSSGAVSQAAWEFARESQRATLCNAMTVTRAFHLIDK